MLWFLQLQCTLTCPTSSRLLYATLHYRTTSSTHKPFRFKPDLDLECRSEMWVHATDSLHNLPSCYLIIVTLYVLFKVQLLSTWQWIHWVSWTWTEVKRVLVLKHIQNAKVLFQENKIHDCIRTYIFFFVTLMKLNSQSNLKLQDLEKYMYIVWQQFAKSRFSTLETSSETSCYQIITEVFLLLNMSLNQACLQWNIYWPLPLT